mmetsp:Transcript_263/g.555  ORF Transcript_263/g.555 Transcript_263/m.555 type:complete len:204 (-) Transcript_263:256-867(-)|eukprot:CAMPEP_0119563368 /NCGR_PEP_ID=MMETSP1352-20130426/23179_1 /TAXON_ID=265584 /ORGANISM="Stauroneis constricta, Strain CCMP1120" /LENGTH=203 /DNA_ID=CAMNT_0007611949 /DNA_START=108 /DNA_END=719 /DNA_ORIENTATION=+
MRSPSYPTSRAFRPHAGEDEGVDMTSPRRNVKNMYSPTGRGGHANSGMGSIGDQNGRHSPTSMIASPPYMDHHHVALSGGGSSSMRNSGYPVSPRGSRGAGFSSARNRSGDMTMTPPLGSGEHESMFQLFPEKTRIEYLDHEDNLAASYYASTSTSTRRSTASGDDDDDGGGDAGFVAGAYTDRRYRRDGHSGYDWDKVIQDH